MSRREAGKQTKQSTPGNKKRKLVVTVGLLIWLLVTTGILAQRVKLRRTFKPTTSLGPNAVPIGFDAGSPAKEYVYAGSRLAATEEPCVFALSSLYAFYPLIGWPGSANITTGTGCPWSVSSPNWILLTSASSGSSNDTPTYEVRENFTAAPRQGTITVGGQTFNVKQKA